VFWSRRIALALLALTLPPNLEPPPEAPLERGDAAGPGTAELADSWTPRSAHVTAVRVRLNGLGARTHANWVLFRLPFDATQRQRLRRVRFIPSSNERSDVGALRIGSVCVPVPAEGGVESWAMYTMSGVGGTERFGWHPAPPTDDPTIAGINVPTRVANWVACGDGDGHLREPENWTLEVVWEER
jgi:hypothetical protein